MPQPAPGAEARSGRAPVLRFLALVGLLAVGVGAFHALDLDQAAGRERLAAGLAAVEGAWWAPLALVGLYLLLCPLGVPASPLVAAGGAVFGVGRGFLLNLAGAWLAAVATFLLARGLGRELVVRLAGPERIARLDRLLAAHGFWALFRLRFVPVPFALANVAAALLGFSFPQFAAASALGLAPPLALYTWLGHLLVTTAAADRAAVTGRALLFALLLAAVVFAPTLWRLLRRLGRRP
jgi:uncharacterized membrane protein YdjX (TVP38/TMEM64 family)